MRYLGASTFSVAALAAVALSTPYAGQAGAAVPPSYSALAPGDVTVFAETVPVTIVYAGITPGLADVQAELPATGSPVIRIPELYYGVDSDLGIRYTYDYHHVVADQTWTDQLYAQMDALAGEHQAHEGLTAWQQEYNAQAGALRTLQAEDNQVLDALAMEQWLSDHPPAGVDTTMPTIFYLDRSVEDGWYPHVYVKADDPDPDTGHVFADYGSRKLVGWGGTAHNDSQAGDGTINRVWFYDLSAGPEPFAGSFEITTPDLDGDGAADYRIPPAWHYAGAGYQHPGFPGVVSLSADLGKVTRFVGLNLLFTSSPLYPPFFTDDRIPETVNIDINTVEGWDGVNASEELLDPGVVLSRHEALPTGYTLSVDSSDVAFKGDVQKCYLQWVRFAPCYEEHPQYHPFANLFLNWAHRAPVYQDGDADYEVGMVNYAIGRRGTINQLLLGYADDNWLDGTQSGAFSFTDPQVVPFGYGLTGVGTHELGHHMSMSHPHDGYDPELDLHYGPSGDTYFAWLGDYSSSVMNYLHIEFDFSQFDQDNAARHHAAGFALIANRVAAAIEGAPGSAIPLAAADAELAAAQAAFSGHEYVAALDHAEAAYRLLLAWADDHGVPIEVQEPSTWTLLPESRLGHLIGKPHGPIAGAIDADPVQTTKWRSP